MGYTYTLLHTPILLFQRTEECLSRLMFPPFQMLSILSALSPIYDGGSYLNLISLKFPLDTIFIHFHYDMINMGGCKVVGVTLS